MGLTRVSAPATTPVTLAEAKAHLRVEHSDDDTILQLYIAGETAYAEDFTGRAFVPQTWDYYLDALPGACDPQTIELPLPRVIDVTGVYYTDTDGVEQTLSTDVYVVDLSSEPARIGLKADQSWPIAVIDQLNAIRIRFEAGYQDSSVSPPEPDVLEDIKIAILLRVQATYDGGEMADTLRETAEVYLRRRRVHLALA